MAKFGFSMIPRHHQLFLGLLPIILFVSFIPFVLTREQAGQYNDIATMTSATLAMLFCLALTLRHWKTEFRSVGIAFTLMLAFFTAAEAVWIAYPYVFGVDVPMPSYADLFWTVGFIPLAGICIRTIWQFRKEIKTGVAGMLTYAYFLTASVLLLYPLFTKVLSSSVMTTGEKFITLFYPVLDFIVLYLMLVLILLYRAGKLRFYWVYIMLAQVVFTVADIIFGYYNTYGDYFSGSLPDMFYMLGYLLFAISFSSFLSGNVIFFSTASAKEEKPAVPDKYTPKKGKSYLLKDETPDRALGLFHEMVTSGVPGLCITRTHPDTVREKYSLKDTPVLWLSTQQKYSPTLSPTDIGTIVHTIEEFMEQNEGSAVLIDGIDYLITNNGFDKILRVINDLKDITTIHKCTMLVHVTPPLLNEKEFSLFSRNMEIMK